MHPRIKQLYELIKDIDPQKVLDVETLFFLKEQGATRTEASITLHLGFGFEIEKTDQFVLQSKVWPFEHPEDVLFQTLKYVYYNPDDPNYEADDNRVQVPL